jgi:SAM-dependent methyltransferase
VTRAVDRDPLSPPSAELLAAWAARVRADREQVERAREVSDPPDFYAPLAHRFHLDPRRTDDAVLEALLRYARAEESWLDVGAGGGRYALPLALRVREVVAVEPSTAMVAALREGAATSGIDNVRLVTERWPTAGHAPGADVGLMAHVGYDIAEIGAFLDALEAASRRLCVAVMGESAMTTVATLFWHAIHGERRVRLPALPELLVLLLARGRLPEVTLVERVPPAFQSQDEALAMARRQLWVREGSAKDERLSELIRRGLRRLPDDRLTFDERPSRVGVVSWLPR